MDHGSRDADGVVLTSAVGDAFDPLDPRGTFIPIHAARRRVIAA